ncbi:MmcB family DNA repair protein [Erythrobacter sp. SCSIO 43205]|nr:MmcB family DNA repair protein [Erythrobacter sp. SCSIO 43205]
MNGTSDVIHQSFPLPNASATGTSAAETHAPTGSQTPTAQEVARGIKRLFARNDIWCVEEMALPNNRRADLMGIDARGQIILVEIKVARGDLMGDNKWPDYLDFCDRFFWGVPPELDRSPLESEAFLPERCGVIVADGYDAEILRHAPLEPLAAARRKSQVEKLARAAMRRNTALVDPHCLDVNSAG